MTQRSAANPQIKAALPALRHELLIKYSSENEKTEPSAASFLLLQRAPSKTRAIYGEIIYDSRAMKLATMNRK